MKPLLLLLLFSQILPAQNDYLEAGNKLIKENNNAAAEQLFREAVASNKENLAYRNQLALALFNQKKYVESEKEILAVLQKDSLNVPALWYGGVNNFTAGLDFRKAIAYFEKAYPFIPQTSGQYFGINFFIGKSYRNLLKFEGLSYKEINRMVETLQEYNRLQPNASDAEDVRTFLAFVEKNRPPASVKRWVVTSQKDAKAVMERFGKK